MSAPYPPCKHRPNAMIENSDPCDDCVREAEAPTPMMAGTFAIYEDGQGGYVLVTETTEHGTTKKHIPAALVKLATGGGMLSRKLGFG